MMGKDLKLTRQQVKQIAAEIPCDERTVARWAAGRDVPPLTEYALTAAGRKLKLIRGRR